MAVRILATLPGDQNGDWAAALHETPQYPCPMRTLAAALLTLALVLPASAQTPPSNEELRKEIEALKKGQEEINRSLLEIRRYLAQQQAQAQAAAAPAPAPPATVDIKGELARGNANARVAIIEYSDYQCPFCARHVSQTYPQIDKEYIETGKVKYIFRDLPLSFHPFAFKAAEASHCSAEQGKFWEMHDRLFANQKLLAPAELTKHAEALGLDTAKFQQCLDSAKYANEIRRESTQANSWGIEGTPTFIVGVVQPDATVKVVQQVVGARGYDDFKAAIEAALATR